MTNFKSGDIVLVSFPFVDNEQTKRRPALVLLDTGDADLVVARVTSQPRQDEFDIEIADWRGAGLLVSSVARLSKLATLEKSLVARTLGKLQPTDYQAICATLEQLFSGWRLG
ncbi:MAG: type II toxin-antitoxin system PemK/MazF family toxin [Anaerolineales bacterium]|nr:type II toxin-antitoxin system PemK/MazF family toxin [Anaerolineales bacterium]